MDINFLRSFVLVADSGSMSEAARRLDLTPAAVAQQVRALQREMGTPLLARAGRTVAPTEAGHRLVVHARALLRDFGHLKASVNDELAQGELHIGAINTALHSLLPDVLAAFARRHPQVRVHIRSGLSVELYDAVRQQQLDAALCLHPAYSLPKALHWETLRNEPLVVLAPQRLARRAPHELLAREPFIRYDRSVGGGKQAERYLRHAGISPHERFELSSLAAIALLVDRGLGVSLVPDAATPWPGLRVARLPLPQADETRRVGIVWPRASLRARLIQGLVDSAGEVLRAA